MSSRLEFIKLNDIPGDATVQWNSALRNVDHKVIYN